MGEVVQLRMPSNSLFARSVLDELTVPLGFRYGSLALYRAGYRTMGAVFNSDSRDLRRVPGIGRRKVSLIQQYFSERGLPHPRAARQRAHGQLEMRLAI